MKITTVTVVIQNGSGVAANGKTQQEVIIVQWVTLESSDTIRDSTELMNCVHVNGPDSITFLLCE